MREPAVSTMVRPEGEAIDFDALRATRRQRLLDAMAAHGLDALILGRPANAFYASEVANEVVDIDNTDNKLYAISGRGPRRRTARRLIRLPAADALERVQTSRD